MDIYTQEKIERRQWRIAAGLTTGLVLFMLGLLGCQKKPKAVPARTTTIYADTTRTKLVHRVDSTGQIVVVTKELANQTVTSYEKAIFKYDSIQLDLP